VTSELSGWLPRYGWPAADPGAAKDARRSYADGGILAGEMRLGIRGGPIPRVVIKHRRGRRGAAERAIVTDINPTSTGSSLAFGETRNGGVIAVQSFGRGARDRCDAQGDLTRRCRPTSQVQGPIKCLAGLNPVLAPTVRTDIAADHLARGWLDEKATT
jgi:hypothetical protein